MEQVVKVVPDRSLRTVTVPWVQVPAVEGRLSVVVVVHPWETCDDRRVSPPPIEPLPKIFPNMESESFTREQGLKLIRTLKNVVLEPRL